MVEVTTIYQLDSTVEIKRVSKSLEELEKKLKEKGYTYSKATGWYSKESTMILLEEI